MDKKADVRFPMPIKDDEGQCNKMPPIVFLAKHYDEYYIQISDLMQRFGASVNETDSKGYTGLTYAVKNNNIDLVQYFLTKDIDVSLVDHLGRNVVHHLV